MASNKPLGDVVFLLMVAKLLLLQGFGLDGLGNIWRIIVMYNICERTA